MIKDISSVLAVVIPLILKIVLLIGLSCILLAPSVAGITGIALGVAYPAIFGAYTSGYPIFGAIYLTAALDRFIVTPLINKKIYRISAIESSVLLAEKATNKIAASFQRGYENSFGFGTTSENA